MSRQLQYGQLNTNHKFIYIPFQNTSHQIRCMANAVWLLKNQSSLYPSVHNSTCLGTCLYSAGIHCWNLLKSFVIMGRVAYFISRETALAKTNTIKKQEEDSGKNEGEWTKKVEIRTRNKLLLVGESYAAIFWPTLSSKGENLSAMGSQQRGP